MSKNKNQNKCHLIDFISMTATRLVACALKYISYLRIACYYTVMCATYDTSSLNTTSVFTDVIYIQCTLNCDITKKMMVFTTYKSRYCALTAPPPPHVTHHSLLVAYVKNYLKCGMPRFCTIKWHVTLKLYMTMRRFDYMANYQLSELVQRVYEHFAIYYTNLFVVTLSYRKLLSSHPIL
jgi:hypothetical protein